jgi:hypothetical protein
MGNHLAVWAALGTPSMELLEWERSAWEAVVGEEALAMFSFDP